MTSPLAADPLVVAAIVRFAREGFDAPLRSIAEDAGVSAALLVKRFGSKTGLREACDAAVLESIRVVKHQNIDAVQAGQLLPTLTASDEYAPIVAYALQSVRWGGPLGRAFVEHMVEDATAYTTDAVKRGVVRPSRNEQARVRYLVLSSLGGFMLATQLDPPENPADLPALMRHLQSETTLPMLELFTEGLFTTRRLLDDYLLYVSDPPEDITHLDQDSADPA